MKKILLSLGSIIFAGAILAGGTGAFLADTETSTGNTFASGVIDLKIDNESYATNDFGALFLSTSTSWTLSSLAGKLFFNFKDIKPGDIGEDTISLHVNNNNAWACMDIKLTATPENGQSEPELLVDQSLGANNGELQNYLYFVFWADDGDNVFEQGEHTFKQGLVKDIWDGKNWPLADASTNIWSGSGPILGNTTKYIGKAWCFGNISQTPVAQDGLGKTGSNGPLVRGTGFMCNGKDTDHNIAQTDGIVADVSFYTVQSRSNNSFMCLDTPPPPTVGECDAGTTIGLIPHSGHTLNSGSYDHLADDPVNPNAGNVPDHTWVGMDGPSEFVVWDMGTPHSQVWLVPAIDHHPVFPESIETILYGSNNPNGPWTLGTRTNSYTDGPSNWISDDFTNAWTFNIPYRYIKATAGNANPTNALNQFVVSNDTEIDAICGSKVGQDKQPPVPLSPGVGLVAHYKLDETLGTTASDSSGNALNGALLNGPAWNAGGQINGALKFDGVDDWVIIGDPAALDFGTNSFSYSMWVKVSQSAGLYDEPWSKGGYVPNVPGYDMELGTGPWQACIADGVNEICSDFGNQTLNQWVLLTVVVDRAENLLNLYRNRIQVSQTVLGGFGSVSGDALARIGGPNYFKGLVDDIRIYNRALTPIEVMNLP